MSKNLEYYTLSLSDNVLEKIAEYIISNFNTSKLNEACVVFGGKRPGLILKKLLAQKTGSNILPPHTFSMDEFVVYIASKDKDINFIYELNAVYLIYKIIKENHFLNKKFKNFLNFIPWGYEILNFFEEILLEEVNDLQLLSIQKEAEIGFNLPKTINELLKNIIEIREKFHNILKEKNIYTRGMLYNLVSSYEEISLKEFKKIIFVTPFYLHSTEYKFITKILENNEVVFFFQGNQNDWKQLNLLSNKWNIKISTEDKEKQPEIYFYSTIDTESELLCAHNILKRIPKTEIDKTVVVLPEEETGVSFINYIPSNISEFNFVCGYPVKRSSIYGLLYTIFNAQLTKKANKYHTKNYLETLNNRLIKSLDLGNGANLTSLVIDTIESIITGIFEDENISKNVFLDIKKIQDSELLYEKTLEILKEQKNITTKDKIKDLVEKLHDLLFYSFEKINCFKDLCYKIEILLDTILKNSEASEFSFNLEVINKVYELIDKLKSVEFANEKFSQEDIFKIFLNELENLKLSFYGSPVKGLQVIGFYETRNLNFDNVIILDVNEGVLPYLKVLPSLIPSEILLKLGIDRLGIQEEIQRYHFFRLIFSANKVHLIYIESNDKEKSRFIEQLLWSKQKQLNNLSTEDIYFSTYKTEISLEKQKFYKTKEIIDYLCQMTYSPTALDTYLKCPNKFYFSYVLNLKEKEDIFEEPGGKEIGQFIHKFLENIFKKYEHKKPIVDEEFIEKSLNFFEESFDKELKKSFKTDAFLIKRIMRFVLEQFLIYEKNRIQQQGVYEIVCLEQTLQHSFKFKDKTFNFQLKIDRIERLEDGSFLIIDYKTGDIQITNRNLDNIQPFSREVIQKKIKSFQLPLYIEAVKNLFHIKEVNAMFYDVKTPSCKFFFNEKSSDDFLNIIFEALKFILEEIVDPLIPFTPQETDERYCNLCFFRYMCR